MSFKSVKSYVTIKLIPNRRRLLYYFVAFNCFLCIYYITIGTISGKVSILNVTRIQLGYNTVNKINVTSKQTSFWWTTETRGKYSVIRNYVKSNQIPDYDKSITLVTHGTYEFLKHIKTQCLRWDGALSVSVYCPDRDFPLTLRMIYFLRQCADKCIENNVTWHFVYDKIYGPKLNAVRAPQKFKFNCNVDTIEKIIEKYSTNFRQKRRLPYPINVLRNVARLAAKTQYVFVTDIELYPSINIVPSFLNLIEREKNGLVHGIPKNQPHVYVLPIFEVRNGVKPPLEKSKLKTLFYSRKAIFFHKLICDSCQRFPDRLIWINMRTNINTLNVFRVTKRNKNSRSWEPLYIGTNAEPLYDENLTWDGKKDKMSQMYEMCLLGYNLVILDNAFLVHAPGIKRNVQLDNQRRIPYMIRNKIVDRRKSKSLERKYKSNFC